MIFLIKKPMICPAGILRREVRPLHTEELSVWIRSLIPVPRTPAFCKSSLIASGVAVIIFLGFSGGRIPILGEAIGYIKAYIDPKHLLTNSSPSHLTWLFRVNIEPQKKYEREKKSEEGIKGLHRQRSFHGTKISDGYPGGHRCAI